MKKYLYEKKKEFLKFYLANKNYFTIKSIIWFYLLDKIIFLPGSFLFVKPKNCSKSFKIRRSNKIDLGTLIATFTHGFHKPPILKDFNPKVILDFGSNIGSTLVDFTTNYPESRIFGFEMDAENFKLAQYNTRNFKNIKVSNIAIWARDETIFYNNTIREDGYQILGSGHDLNNISVTAMSVMSILNKFNILHVDYLKMDIEGAERNIFFEGNLEWLKLVSVMNIELHEFSIEDVNLLKNKLSDYNFRGIEHSSHWSSLYVINNSKF